MNFADIRFWMVFAISLFLVLVIRSIYRLFAAKKFWLSYDKVAVFLMSSMILAYASMLTLLIFICVTLTAYFGLQLIRKSRFSHSRWILAFLIILLLLPLVYYKYRFFLMGMVGVTSYDFVEDIAIPIGISFYTFQKIGFVIDTIIYQKPIPAFLDYINFAGFFPQLVAGPIERRDHLLPQMEYFNFTLDWKGIDSGIRLIILGLFFKLCLADNAAALMQGRDTSNVWQIWHNNILFGFRIYFDFAGYGITAVGLGKCFGIDLVMNFKSPYTSSTFREFWQRWHISLTQWFRDYIYFNIGGSKTKFWALNIMIVFLISGIWHGASWNFVIWGGLCGLGLVIYRLYKKLNIELWNPLGWLLTMVSSFFIWMFFYETRLDVLWNNTALLSNPFNYNGDSLVHYFDSLPEVPTVLIGSLVLIAATLYAEYLSLRKYHDPYTIFLSKASCCVMIICMVLFSPGVSNEFIYFAF